MSLKKYLEKISKKVKQLDKMAQNPFLEKTFSYNPFECNAFSQTYIWVEEENHDTKTNKKS